jgi:hypothetical protein
MSTQIMSTQVLVLDDLTLVAPFGVRFWDVAGLAPAGNGLTVTTYPQALAELVSTANIGPSGVYSFRGLPGLGRFENGAGDNSFWTSNPPSLPYVVEVSDPAGQYLPFEFSLLLPVRGLYGFASSPPSLSLTPDGSWLPIFSAPSRELPGPSATIRALLQDTATGGPAAWAMVTAQFQGAPAVTGVANERGIVTLNLSYPEPQNSPFGSPMGLGSVKLSDQNWPVTITVFYSGLPPAPGPFDLQEVLQQGQAMVWADTAHTGEAGPFNLTFGKDLVLRSLDSVTGHELSVLLVTSATSPL